MNLESYSGICRICFEPAQKELSFSFKGKNNCYHKKCIKENPNSYFYAVDRIEHSFNEGENPTALMNEMEEIFKIPALNDPEYNDDNHEVISLYRKISKSRSQE